MIASVLFKLQTNILPVLFVQSNLVLNNVLKALSMHHSSNVLIGHFKKIRRKKNSACFGIFRKHSKVTFTLRRKGSIWNP